MVEQILEMCNFRCMSLFSGMRNFYFHFLSLSTHYSSVYETDYSCISYTDTLDELKKAHQEMENSEKTKIKK